MTAPTVTDLIAQTKKYLAALERGVTVDELADFYAEDVVQEEFPNRLTPNGARRSRADLEAASKRGNQATEEQRYEVLNIFGQGNQVVAEVQWSARLLLPFGTLKPGDSMRARFAVFIVFNDQGLIQAQHNYDCFDPF